MIKIAFKITRRLFLSVPTFKIEIKCKKLYTLLLPFTCFLLFNSGFASSVETGLPFIQSYGSKDYLAHPQNWQVTQDNRGIIYFANNLGVLYYDGDKWETVPTSNKSPVFSVDSDDSSKIYVGATGEFGYLYSDSAGQLQFASLLHLVDKQYHDFSKVWHTVVTKDGVYFRTSKYLFCLTNGKVRAWKAKTSFHRSYYVNNVFYISETSKGLMEIKQDSLVLTGQGEFFSDSKIYAMLPYDSRHSLIGTRDKGFFLHDGKTIHPFNLDFSSQLKEAILYNGLILENGNIVLATYRNGIYVMDFSGRKISQFNSEDGLASNSVTSLSCDKWDGLWVTTQNGISRVEINSPIRYWDKRHNIDSMVESVVRHDGVLYLATLTGIYYLENEPESSPISIVKKIPGANDPCYNLITTQYGLLAATIRGVVQISEKKSKTILSGLSVKLYQSLSDPRRIFVGTGTGLKTIYYKNGQWSSEKDFPEIKAEVRTISENPDGSVWAGTAQRGIYKINHVQDDYSVVLFDTSNGLPNLRSTSVLEVAGRKIFSTSVGLYSFDESRQIFFADSTLGNRFTNNNAWVYLLEEDVFKNVWMFLENLQLNLRDLHYLETGTAINKKDGSYEWGNRCLLRMNNIFYSIYPEEDGTVWLGGEEILVRVDSKSTNQKINRFQSVINSVKINNDSIIYSGFKTPTHRSMEIPYNNNDIRLEYSAPFFSREDVNRFQVKLDGYDEQWKNWSYEHYVEYTNLPPGAFTFHVRAKNIYNEIGAEDSYSFKILSPWYRTGWAYAGYVLFLISLMFLFSHFRLKKITREKRRLEEIVNERTSELAVINKQLKEQAGKLQEMDQVKSRFFENISHEFRTPLTLIIGLIEERLKRTDTPKSKQDYNLVLRNARQLLQLINQLLDLSKLEYGSLKLQLSYGNIVSLVKGIFMSFESLAKSMDISLQFESENESIDLYYDVKKIETILTNLLSNAIKFTGKNGKIILIIKKSAQHDNVEISVKDSGIGIDEVRLQSIFDRFYQADSTMRREYEGSGIGLALTKELVELHHGTIRVNSVPDKGSEFTFTLPLSIEVYAEDSIIKTSQIDHEIPDRQSLDIVMDAEIPVKTEADKSSGKAKLKILVVEDNADVRLYIFNTLKEIYNIIEAENGIKGLQIATKEMPDLIISDVMMPKMDGFQLTDKLKKHPHTSHIPIILLTAKAAMENKLDGLTLGADDYLVKPFNSDELKVRIKNLIVLRQKLRDKFSKNIMVQPGEITVTSVDEKFMLQAAKAVEENIENPDFNVEDLAAGLALSRQHLHRKLKALTGQSATQFIRSIRLKRAAQLLSANFGSATEVAYKAGFNNISYFAKCFKKQFGVPPKDYPNKS